MGWTYGEVRKNGYLWKNLEMDKKFSHRLVGLHHMLRSEGTEVCIKDGTATRRAVIPPLLFNLYITDIYDKVMGKSVNFANDGTV